MKVKDQFLELSSFKLHNGNNIRFFYQRASSHWLERLSGTPQVLGLTLRGSEFQAGVKKNPLVCPRPKHRLRAGQLTGYSSLCMDGAKARGFSRSM
jgi:hypothetical protein